MPLNKYIQKWFEDPEFQNLPLSEKEAYIGEFFDRELVGKDPEGFAKLSEPEQRATRSNFIEMNLAPNWPEAPSRGLLSDIMVAGGRALVGVPEMFLRSGAGVHELFEEHVAKEPEDAFHFATWAREKARNIYGWKEEHLPVSKEALEGGPREWITSGIESAGTSLMVKVPAAIGGFVLGGPVGAGLGWLSGVPLFSLSQFDQSLTEYRKRGLTEREAREAALLEGASEGGFELLTDFVEIITLGTGTALTAPSKEVLKKGTFNALKGAWKQAVKKGGVVAGAETLGELANVATQAEIRHQTGIDDQRAWDAIKANLGSITVASLIFGSLGGGLNLTNARVTRKLLEDSAADPKKRMAAVNEVANNLRKVSPELARQWTEGAVEAVTAREAINVNIKADLEKEIPKRRTPEPPKKKVEEPVKSQPMSETGIDTTAMGEVVARPRAIEEIEELLSPGQIEFIKAQVEKHGAKKASEEIFIGYDIAQEYARLMGEQQKEAPSDTEAEGRVVPVVEEDREEIGRSVPVEGRGEETREAGPVLQAAPEELIPTSDKGWEETPSGAEDIWLNMMDQVEAVRNRNAPKIKALEDELKSIKGKRGKEFTERRKQIRDELQELKDEANLLFAQFEDAIIEDALKMHEEVRAKAAQAGVPEESLEDFVDEFSMAISLQRPYIEYNYNKTYNQVFDELVKEYLPEEEAAPPAEKLKPAKEKPVTVTQILTGKKPTPEERKKADLEYEERRKNLKRRKRIDEMTPDEMRRELLVDPLTGLGNRRAYEEAEKLPYQVSIDADSLKYINDNYGHDAGDNLLRKISAALKSTDLVGELYRFGGDEFLAQGHTEEEVDRAIEQAYNYLEQNPIQAVTEDKEVTIPARFSYGTAETIEEADERLRRHKEEREARGERARRGEEPPGIFGTVPQRVEAEDRAEGVHEAEVKPPPKPRKPPKPSESKVRTLRGRIKEMGGINFLNYTGELRDMPLDVKYLAKKTGDSIDNVVDRLKSDNWLDQDATVESFLEDLRTRPEILRRDRVTRDVEEKKEYELSPQDKRLLKEMEWEPEAPPEGEYIQMRAEDLPEDRKLTIIEGKSSEGWDRYQVTEKDPFSITLVDGDTIELKPLDIIEVLKEELPKTVPTEQTKIKEPKPKLFGPPEEARPKVKPTEPKKLAAVDLVSREESSKFEQDKLFEPNQQKLFQAKKTAAEILTGKKPKKKIEEKAEEGPFIVTQILTGKKLKEKQPVGKPGSSDKLAEWVENKLKGGYSFSWKELFSQADKDFGGTQAEGAYTPKDAYDAMELGVNRMIADQLTIDPTMDEKFAEGNVKALKELIEKLPTQTRRTEEMDEFQQFSTPPPLAYIANWVANINNEDVVLEPSAGIGGLAVFSKLADADQIIVNELSPRRAELLKLLGFDKVFTENAEQLHNILPKDVKPSVVMMNPPFSATAGRIRGARATKVGARHIDQALARLEPNGRLVAIVGKGMADDAAAFRDWWRKIKQIYNVQANIGISGKEYKKYGTTFDNQILVIDKTGKSDDNIVKGKVETLEGLLPLLREVRDARESKRKQPGLEPGGKEGVEEPGPEPTVLPPGGERRTEEQEPEGGVPAAPGEPGRAPVRVEPGEGHEVPGGRTRPTERPTRKAEPAGPERGGPGAAAQPTVSDAARISEAEAAASELQIKAVEKEVKGELTEDLYESYTPELLEIPGSKKHPSPLVQSAAMAAVTPPKPTYKPSLPEKIIKAGNLSKSQLESVVYAGQSHEEVLRDGSRRGYFIGDGTGVGKGREIAGIIWDNWNKGRKKAVWISEKAKLLQDAQRDVEGTGWDPDVLFPLSKIKSGSEIAANQGVLFTTYDTLKSRPKEEEAIGRLDQIVNWLGKDFDGVIAFDEAHNMGNAIEVRGPRGRIQPAAKALAGVELQQALPNARILYVSATGATDVRNLSYAERLGLWGEGTSFPNKHEFIHGIINGGIAAMEMVAQNMKAVGVYNARSLSYKGVEYDTIEHKLSPAQIEQYNKLADAWQVVLKNINEALELTDGAKNGRARGNALSIFWAANQRFFNQVITTMQLPSVINKIHEDLKKGASVVIQLVNTLEAAQERALAKLTEEDSLEDLDLSPFDDLMQMVERSFPVTQFEGVADNDGNVRYKPVYDSNGNPVQNAEAVEMRDRLLDELGVFRREVADGVIDQIIAEFGVENVAEVTGRKRRVIKKVTEKGTEKVIEKRSWSKAKADIDAFMNDKKKILIFSEAGGTGASYDADLNVINQRKRMHYVLQSGWRADKVIQGLGRTHRSNQKQPPAYFLVTTDLKGQKRFISSIARRLDQLGALTRGARETGSQGIFSARDNLETEYAEDALQMFIKDLHKNLVPGMTIGDFESQTALKVTDEIGNLNCHNVRVKNLLNRILSMRVNAQNRMFSEFSMRLDDVVNSHIEAGTLDVGLETLEADKIEKTGEEVVYADEKSGAETKYVRLEITSPSPILQFKEAEKWAADGFYQNVKSQKVWAVKKRATTDRLTGEIKDQYYLKSSNFTFQILDPSKIENEERWTKLKKGEAQNLWESEVDELPKTITEERHLITGALLPIWNRLIGHPRIMRVQTDAGERMIGRIIAPQDLQRTLKNLGATAAKVKMTPQEAHTQILANNYRLELANGWKILRKIVSDDFRIEIQGPYYSDFAILKKYGVFSERINWQTRFFIPTDKSGVEAIENILRDAPIVEAIPPRAQYAVTSVKPWPEDFPNAIPHTTLKKLTSHKDYKAAKAGDTEAALRLVDDLINIEKANELANKYPDAIIVPILAQEEAGKNKIPAVFAQVLSDITGLAVEKNILQSNIAGHTKKTGLTRLLSRAKFEGKVEQGQYIIIDDAIAQGGTIYELRHYIDNNGGETVAIVTLGYGKGATVVAVKPETIKNLERKFGREEIEKFLNEFDVAGSLDAITEGEARYLLSYSSIESIRERFAKEGYEPVYGPGEGPVTPPEIIPDYKQKAKIAVRPGEAGLSLEDIRAVFKGQHVGLSNDGSVWVRTKKGHGLVIRTVDHITDDRVAFEVGYGRMQKSGELLAGKYVDSTIELQKDMADKWTLYHELEHWAEDIGLLSDADIRVLNAEIRAQMNKDKYYVVSKEERAKFIENNLEEREKYRDRGRLYRILQRIRDFIDALANLAGRTAKGVAREFETGRLFGREGIPAARARTPVYETTAGRWYSQMEKHLEEKLPGFGDPAQIKQTIQSWANKGLIKQEELQWSGLLDWLDEPGTTRLVKQIPKKTDFRFVTSDENKFTGQRTVTTYYKGKQISSRSGTRTTDEEILANATWRMTKYVEEKVPLDVKKITKEQVLGFLAENNVRLDEFIRGDAKYEYRVKEYEDIKGEVEWEVQARLKDGGQWITVAENFDNPDAAEEEMQNIAEAEEGDVFTKYSKFVLSGGEKYKELLLTLPMRGQLPKGYKVIQNDGQYDTVKKGAWLVVGNDGKIYGSSMIDRDEALKEAKRKIKYNAPEIYRSSHWDEPNVLAHVRFDERTGPEGEKVLHIAEIQSDWHQKGRKKGYKKRPRKIESIREKEYSWLVTYNDGDRTEVGKAIADTEAKARLYIEERIKEDVIEGVPDAPFKKTWPLLAIKRMVRYAAENGFDVVSWDTGSIQAERYDLSKHINELEWYEDKDGDFELIAKDHNDNTVISETSISREKLPDYIGKELADKIINQVEADEGTEGVFKGLDLKVGGEGMRSFYDRLLPNMVNKFFNKPVWGKAKIEPARLKVTDMPISEYDKYPEGHPYKEKNYPRIWQLPITKEMKSKALREGMPLFKAIEPGPAMGKQLQDDLERDRSFANRIFEQRDVGIKEAEHETQQLQKEVQRLAGEKSRKRHTLGFAYDKELKRSRESDMLDMAMMVYRDLQINPEKANIYKDWAERALADPETPKSQKIQIKENLEILERSERLSDEQKEFVDDIGKRFTRAYMIAKANKVVNSFLDHYVRRVWKLPKGKAEDFKSTGAGYGFKTFTTAKLKRSFETIIDGWMEGYELSIKGLTNSYGAYISDLEAILANKDFIVQGYMTRDADNRRLFSTSSRGAYKDYAPLKAPGFKVWEWAGKAETEIAPEANNALLIDDYGRRFFFGPVERIPEMWAVHKVDAEGVVSKRAVKLFMDEKSAMKFAEEREYRTHIAYRPPKDVADAWERRELYAPSPLAEIINKMTAGDKLFPTTPALESLARLNSGLKAWLLLSSFFHHIAGGRSWGFGVHHGWRAGKTVVDPITGEEFKTSGWNPVRAYKEGLKKIDDRAPIIRLGIKNGLTLGELQDWSEVMLRDQKGFTERLARHLGMEKVSKGIAYGRFMREKFTDSLFKKYFTGLKAEAFVMEYIHELQKAQNDHLTKGAPAPDINLIAEQVARLINADFGGLHLQRMGRNPTLQKLARLLLLAPDWTESNFRTVTGMIPGLNKWISKMTGDVKPPPGMDSIYRRFWGRVALRIALATILVQLLMNGMDDSEDYWREQALEGRFNKSRWLEVDITRIYNALGIDTEGKRKTFSIGGHFFDPLKLFDPARLIKHKGSPIVRVIEAIASGADWRGRPFVSTKELITEGKTVKESPYEPKEQFFDRLPAAVVNLVTNLQPVQVGYAIRYMQGEDDALSSLMRATGMQVHTAYPPKMIGPMAHGPGRDRVYEAIQELVKEDVLTMGPPSKNLSVSGIPQKMTPAQYNQYLTESSDLIRSRLIKLVDTERWEEMTPLQRSKMVEKIVKASRKRARAKLKRKDFKAKYPPKWSSEEERAFLKWYRDIADKWGLNLDPDDSRHHYDYRKAYRADASPDKTGHWPSRFKKKTHPRRYLNGVDTITGRRAA